MTKRDFLERLGDGLSGLPRQDIEERLSFYEEMIEDGMEEGLSEEDAVAAVGSVEDIVSQTVDEIPITRLVAERVRPDRPMKVWEVIALVLGSPIWLTLLIAAAVVLFAVFVVIWVVALALCAVCIAPVAGAIACVAFAAVTVLRAGGQINWSLLTTAAIGAALVLAGLAILMFLGCKGMTAGAFRLTKGLVLKIKNLFIKKENE